MKLTKISYSIILRLGISSDKYNSSRLSRLLNFSYASVAKKINELIIEGYVKKLKIDKRESKLSLSEKGKKLNTCLMKLKELDIEL